MRRIYILAFLVGALLHCNTGGIEVTELRTGLYEVKAGGCDNVDKMNAAISRSREMCADPILRSLAPSSNGCDTATLVVECKD